MVKRPNTRTNLDKAIQRLYGQTVKFVNIRSLMANVIVGQFLPGAVAKGGSALKLRFGDLATRMTTDFDIAYRDGLDDVIATLNAGLKFGWNVFDGEVVAQKPMRPKGIREAYVMKPNTVKAVRMSKRACDKRDAKLILEESLPITVGRTLRVHRHCNSTEMALFGRLRCGRSPRPTIVHGQVRSTARGRHARPFHRPRVRRPRNARLRRGRIPGVRR